MLKPYFFLTQSLLNQQKNSFSLVTKKQQRVKVFTIFLSKLASDKKTIERLVSALTNGEYNNGYMFSCSSIN